MVIHGAKGAAFESLVSFEGSETFKVIFRSDLWFESLVSFEGSETQILGKCLAAVFESLVSFEGSETTVHTQSWRLSV